METYTSAVKRSTTIMRSAVTWWFFSLTEMCSLLADDPNCESCIIDSTGKKMCTSCKDGTVLGADGKCADQGTPCLPSLVLSNLLFILYHKLA